MNRNAGYWNKDGRPVVDMEPILKSEIEFTEESLGNLHTNFHVARKTYSSRLKVLKRQLEEIKVPRGT